MCVCMCTSNATNVLGQLSEFSSRQLLTQRVALPPHPHTIASVACSLLKKPWTESGSTQQQKEAIGTMLKCVGVGAVGRGGGGGKDVL